MPFICLIAALPAEARPLIAYFGMQSVAHQHLKIFSSADLPNKRPNQQPNKQQDQRASLQSGHKTSQRSNQHDENEDNSVLLVQCGIGKLNAAAATAALLQAYPDIGAIINVGIAGSDHPLGSTFFAHHVKDAASGQQWFPHLPPVRKLGHSQTTSVLTVDTPAENYTSDTAFDMEAAGIFAAATKTLDLAFVHSVKVVSDNAQSSINGITAKTAADNIQSAIPSIVQLIDALPFNVLPSSAEAQSLVHSLCSQLHYTETERHALKQLLHRHSAILGYTPNEQSLVELGNAKAIRHKLNIDIDQASVTY